MSLATWTPIREFLEGAANKPGQVPSVEVLIGCFTGSIVAAGQDPRDVIDFVAVKGLDNIKRELLQEREVVGRMYDEYLFRVLGEAMHIGHWTDRSEDLPHGILGKPCLLECLADVTCTLSGPDDIAEPGRRVIEGADLKARIVCGGYECVAGAQAGT